MSPQTPLPQTAFEKYLAERLQEPGIRAGYEDQTVLQRVIDRLVGFRKALGLTQTEVARRMGVGQSTVSGFETEMSDPRLSTLQRYARAVEARLDVVIDWDATCDWVSERPRPYSTDRVARAKVVEPQRQRDVVTWPSTRYEQQRDFGLTA